MSARNLEDRKGYLELQRAIRNGMRLVDGRTGIIQGLFELPLEANDPKFFHIAAPLTDTSRYFGVQCYRHNGGAALTRERATIAAIGEAIERYCSGMYDPDAIFKARAKDLGDAAVGPWQFALFSETQYSRPDFPLSKPLESAVFGWVQGYSLTRNTDVYVPACFVYVPYRFMNRTEFVTVPISTGLACGTSLEDAILRGIYEVVERDAFSIVWLNRLNVPRLRIEDFSSREVLAVVEKFREVGIDLCVNLATTDLGIPVVITLALDDTGAGPASVIAARADFDLEYAVMRSLEETAQTRLWAKKLMRDKPDYEPKPGFTDVVSGEDHVRLFASPNMRKHIEFLTEAPFITGSGPFLCPADEDVRGRIRRCVDMLSFHGYETIVVDITTPDIREAGFRVVRVLVPGLQPLDMNHNWRYLGGKRLYEAPVKMGFFEKPKSPEELNGIPHPFP